ncbi:inositol-3-phosphate synthase [Methanogenium organophilum]|uniref:Inositol-3-phosphate synthase n=1 Tax=Methanogenium organophilum TaxID=2199 RepID=A0A9X9S3Q9_METOG|nr:inositol-3-phosphate synthase [Methanogenium organophilum]WAI00945.1 inositol-3-phosphate synthase [Methanogenium organophilum]
MGKIKIAIVGIGNCASSLIQGIYYYRHVNERSGLIPGILHNEIGGYKISDIECVAAFDINRNKIGKDVSEAIFSCPNNAVKFADVPKMNVNVKKGPQFDGVGEELKRIIDIDYESNNVDIKDELVKSKADILINFLPTGSVKATEFYAKQALDANCCFINAIPVFIASNQEWSDKFKEKNLPLVGDDVKSQIGATILHRTIIEILVRRGVFINKSYQSNIGGNADFINLTETKRLKCKRISKIDAIESLVPYDSNVVFNDPEYSSELHDTKKCNIKIFGRNFGDLPIKINLDLEVQDSPNSAGIMVDVIRGVQLARDNNRSGSINEISSLFFKHPEIQIADFEAHDNFEKFINS